jgi:hypothetical protein
MKTMQMYSLVSGVGTMKKRWMKELKNRPIDRECKKKEGGTGEWTGSCFVAFAVKSEKVQCD